MSKQPSLVSLLTLFGLILLPNLQAQKPSGKTPSLLEGVQAVRDLEYAVRDSISLKLDLYLPREEVKFPLPVVVWIHGGGWLNGSKDKCPGVYLAARGFAVASISYRLVDSAKWPSQIDDCYEAVRWLRGEAAKTYSLDPDHIGVWGGSAGGHLAALVGTRPAGEEAKSSRVQAVCDWYGPSDLLTMPPNLVSVTRTAEQVAQSNGAKLLGATVRDVPDLAKDASAFYQVSGDDPPFLIMHGSADPGVPIDQSQRLHETLVRAGVESEFVVVEGAGHGGKEFQTEAVKEKVATFFEKTLRP